MNKLLMTLTCLFILSSASSGQFTLKIEIKGLRNNTGKIMLQLFNEKQEVIKQEMGEIKDKSCSFTEENLKPGKYAVRFYHDENLDQKMETNIVGKPTEGYGFSNNVTGKFSMPPFEKWLFDVNEDKSIVINAVY